MTTSSRESSEGEEKYRSIFEHAAVSLWEEDISRLRSKLDEMRSAGGVSLRTHVEAHPEFVQEAARLIEVTDVNRSCLLLFGADRKEQLLGPLDIVLDAVSWTALSDTILAIDEGRTESEVESSAVTLKGRKLSLIVKSHIPSAHAAYPCMIVSLIDITARKEAEKRVRTSAIILQSIVESFPDSIFVKDASLRMVLCNRALSRAIGREPKDTYGKTDVENGWSAELVKGSPEKGIIGWERDDLAALSGRTVQVTEEPTDFDNGVRYYDTSKFPLRDDDGTIIGLVGIGRDVTERKKAETELRRAKQFAENLIDTANVMILGLDLEGRVKIFNEAAEQITGYTRAEMMNRSWLETVVPRSRYPEVWAKFERLTREKDVGTFENPIITKAGEERFMSWKNNQILENGQVAGTLSFGIDITAQKALQSRINRAERLESLAILAGGVAHQFNNINSVVLGYLGLIRSGPGLPARLASYAAAASEAVEKASGITGSLLALTEPAGMLSNVVRFDILARAALQLQQDRLEKEHVQLVLDLDETPPVAGSESRWRFVASRIIDNALDSLQDRMVRIVTVRTGVTDECAFLEVEDTGCGISEEDLPRIFSPFFSTKGEWAPPASPQAKLKGVGLSLAISNTTVSEYGGMIEVRSTKEAGSVFRVLMPFTR